jgi:CRISPR-associated protein Cas1
MTDHILDISEQACRLFVRDERLVLQAGQPEVEAPTVPLSEVAAVVVAHRQVTYTQAVLSGLAEHGAVLVACNERHLPVGMMVPLHGHSLVAERLHRQIAVGKPLQKRLWQQLVQAKVHMQADVLRAVRGTDGGLDALCRRVHSGDTSNVEAQAARRYWALLFRDGTFRRDTESGDPFNGLLNYGYAVLRAMVARALVASGLNVTLGLHHHNRSNAYCLADDVMEPFRPIVDREVAVASGDLGPTMEINRESKGRVLKPLMGRVKVAGESRTLFDAFARLSASLAGIYAGEGDECLDLPKGLSDFANE